MWKWTCVITGLLVFLMVTNSSARRTHVTPDQKSQLARIQTVLLHVLALTENGRVPPDDLIAVIQPRLEELGFIVVTDRKQPYDVEFKVKCEERKRWEGTTRSGGDAELADAPARLWKGPACLFSYRLNGQDLGWYKEVRTDFEDAYQAAQAAKDPETGKFALDQLKIKLQEFDFPIMIATEWDQPKRFIPFLKDPNTPKPRMNRILDVLTKEKVAEAYPYLKNLLHDKEYGEKAIVAFAGIGSPAIPLLSDLLKNGATSNAKAAAAKGLGIIAAHTGDPATNTPLLEYLTAALQNMNSSDDIDFPVLTEVVWSIGKLRSDKFIKPIEELNRKIWLIRDTSPEMEKLRDAANVATKMVDLDYQIM